MTLYDTPKECCDDNFLPQLPSFAEMCLEASMPAAAAVDAISSPAPTPGKKSAPDSTQQSLGNLFGGGKRKKKGRRKKNRNRRKENKIERLQGAY